MATSTPVVNEALYYILAVSALLLVFITFLLVYFLVRYRRSRNPVAQEVVASPLLEVAWVGIPTLIVITMFFYGLTGYRFLREVPADAMTVKVHSRQWSFLFEYPGGLKSPDLVVPVGQNIRCELTSVDVLHAFYVPAFRIQEDIVPGLTTQVWFRALTPGTYSILCAQYCGLQHSAMLAKLIVVPQDQFDSWQAGEEAPWNQKVATPENSGKSLLTDRACLACHSLDGTRIVGPSFKGLFGSMVTSIVDGAKKVMIADSAYLHEAIMDPGAKVADGYTNLMPPGRDVLSEQEVARMIEFLKTQK